MKKRSMVLAAALAGAALLAAGYGMARRQRFLPEAASGSGWVWLTGGADETALQPQAERDFVRAELTYDAGTRTLRGTQSVTITNRTGAPLQEIVLRAYMNGWTDAGAVVSGAALAGEEIRFAEDADDPTVLRADCALAAGETAELTFTVMLRHAKDSGIVQLPVPALWADGAWRTDAFDALADSSYAEAFDFTVTVDGVIAAQMRGARDASFALYPEGRTRRRTACGVRLTAMAQDGKQADVLLNCAEDALESLRDAGLPYPFEALTIVQAQTGRADGRALSGLIALETDADRETLTRRITRLIARETFGIWVESDPWNAPWLSESLASCAEMLAYRQRKGRAAFDERLYGEIELSTRLTRPQGVTVGAGVAHFGGDAEMTQVLRDQGAAMLLGMEQAMGEDAFLRALTLYVERHAGAMAEEGDLAAALEEASGSSWAGYLADGLLS